MTGDKEDKTEKVNWVLPLSKGAVLGKTPVSNLQKAAEQKGIRIDNMATNEKGQIVADIYQDVVVGMPAPRNDPSKDQK